MPAKRIKAEDFPRVLQAHLKRDFETAKAVALDTALWGEREATRLTNDRHLIYLHHFKLAWTGGSKREPFGASLRNNVPYAAVIEHGRRPKRPGPPLEPIREWVRVKLVGNGKVDPKDLDRVAFLVRQAIHHRGTPPRHVLRDTVRGMKIKLRKDIVAKLRSLPGNQ